MMIMYKSINQNFTVSFLLDLLMLTVRGSPRSSAAAHWSALVRSCSSTAGDVPTSVNVHEHKLSRPTKAAKPRVRVKAIAE